jgi:TolB-like protein/Flp pilus assembly protein TadD
MSSILKDRPKPVREQRPDVPGDVCRLIERCLEKEPRDRIQTAAEILAELKANRRAWESESDRSDTPALDGNPQPAARAASIAVLAFTDMSAAKDQDWFCDGIAEEIINALTPLEGLRVAARASAFSFKGKGDDLQTIGRKLKVTTVLDGSVRRAGDRVRITVQLSNAADGFQMWSERYDRELKDIFDVQDEISKAIAERLRVTLAGGNDVRLVEQATKNVEAYQLYLQGRALLGRRGASIPLALDRFRRAVELDPAYSSAWAGLADSFTGLAITGSTSGAASRGEAIAAATRSIALDPGSAAGHSALANATLLFENDRNRAGEAFERAMELNPSYLLGRCWYALFYLQWARGEIERGITEARRALDLDPLNSYLAMILTCCYCTAGRLEKAVETGRLAIQLDPESFIAHWALGVALRVAGQFEEAVSILERAAVMSSRHARALASLAAVFGDCGRSSEAAAVLDELRERSTRSFVPAAYLALAAEGAGRREEAVALVQQAWRDREPAFIIHARYFPEYRALRSDPRIAAIVREMDSPGEGEEVLFRRHEPL